MKTRILKVLAVLACVAILAGACLPARADTLPYYASGIDYALVSGTAKLNLRSGPGVEYEWIGAAAEGTWVLVTGESGNWYSVYLPDTQQTGYMSKNFLKTGPDSSAAGSTVVVSNPKATQFLNLRQYPDLNAPVLGIYYNGATFRLLSSEVNGWYQVEGYGMTGYFRREYVRVSGASGQSAYVRAANGGKVNLRSAPTYSGSTVLKQLPSGTAVTVLVSSSAAGSFWKISCQGTTGYMDSSFLTATNPAPVPYVPPYVPVPDIQPAAQGTATVNNPKSTQYLNLRAQPSTSAQVIAQYKNGVRFEVIEPGETWTKVYGAASGNIGYFMTRYLKLTGVSSSPTKRVQNGTSYVNLRSRPSKTGGTVYQKVPSGAVVTILTPGDEWTQVRYNGKTGYMMTYFLK